MSTIIKDKETASFIEQDCTIELQGKQFTSGGSWLAQRKDTGKYEGYLYASPETNEITSWDGKLRIPAHYSSEQFHNFGRKQRQVWFKYHGMNFYGKYCCDFNQCIHVKQVR